MEDEYEVPVDFGDGNVHPPPGTGKNAAAATMAAASSSVASSSRVASAASAPVVVVRRAKNYGRTAAPTGMRQQRRDDEREGGSGTATPSGGNSFNSSPLLWNSSTPQRAKSRREFEEKMRQRRRHGRASAIPSFPRNPNDPGERSKKDGATTTATPAAATTGLPLPKALTDLLLGTAMLGVDATAKLSGPTLQLTRNTLLPQLIVPLIREIWEQYVPDRMRTWMKVVPTSLRNLSDLLWDTEAGRALGERAGRLGENAVDLASSEAARQCVVDATVSLIKLADALHTPEAKALLDQAAVGACRVVDALSSGKAKQIWFDLSDGLWALIEVGSDPVMVTALAEGCAQICFALEGEREGLKRRRGEANAAAGCGRDGSGGAKFERMMASKRRRERDRRQAGTYPPGKQVVVEGGGREGIEEALLDGLDGHIDREEDDDQRGFEDQVPFEEWVAKDDGPPQRVIVPTNSSENIGGERAEKSHMSFPEIQDNDRAGDANIVRDDEESEITTEIEDLRRGEDPIEYEDVDTQSSASENRTGDGRCNALAYEQEGKVEYSESIRNELHRIYWPPGDDDGTASEMYDAFDEPILHFYRRLNEVLVETRKESRLDLHHRARQDNSSKEEEQFDGGHDTPGSAANRDALSPPVKALAAKGLFDIQKKWWKLIIIASIVGTVTMCTFWFALGCYGFYVIFIGGGLHVSPPLVTSSQPQSTIVIQLATTQGQEIIGKLDASADREINRNNGVAQISLDDWNQLKLDVDRVISQTSEETANRDNLAKIEL